MPSVKHGLFSFPQRIITLRNQSNQGCQQRLSFGGRVHGDNTNEQLIECTRGNEALIVQRNNQEIQSLKAQIERLNSMHQKEIFDVEWDRDFGGMYHRDF